MVFFLLLQALTTIAQNHPKGELIETVYCSADTSQTYALFLPSNYNKNQPSPILYIFEPAARAKLGVEVFQKAAEKYGYILVCSYNSRNGRIEPIIEAFNAVSKDVSDQFSIDPKRIYMAGFSGGARVAAQFAMESEVVAGVIACGAGFPSPILPDKHYDFLYMGLVGNRDMNFLEMQKLEKNLQKHKFREELMVFEGGHQWADTATVERALQWLELQKMKVKKTELKEETVRDFIEVHQNIIDHTDDDFEKYEVYQILVQTLEGWKETETFQAELQRLKGAETVKTRLENRRLALEKEAQWQKKFLDEFKAIGLSPYKGDSTLKNAAWWKREVRQLQKLMEEGANVEEKWMAERVMDFAWRNAYIQHNQNSHPEAMSVELELARKYLEIWTHFQADQPAPFYVLSKLYVRLNSPKKAIKTMEQAIENGFENWDYLEKDQGFDAIRGMKKFRELVPK